MDLGSIGSIGTQMLFSWGFWLLFGVIVLFTVFGSLFVRKKAKYHYPALIFTENGGGKVSVRTTRAGWFKSDKILGGLIEMAGEKRLEVKDGRFVQNASSLDMHEIDLRPGYVFLEKHDDPKVLIPLSKYELDVISKKLIAQIAPGDYRDACSKIMTETKKELQKDWQVVTQYLLVGFVVIIMFVSIILVIQYSNNAMAEANALYKEGLEFYERTLNRLSAQPSPTAP